MRSTPWPKLTLRTVKLPPGPLRREITVPSKACTRSLSPSLIFTCTRTVSPGLMAGMSLRCSLAASFSMMGCCDIDSSSIRLCFSKQLAISKTRRRTIRRNPTHDRPSVPGVIVNISDAPANCHLLTAICFFYLRQQLSIFLAQLLRRQQVGPIAQRFFQRFAPAPFANLLVVAADQHFRRRHAAKLCRARVVRVVEQSAARARAIRAAGFHIQTCSRKTFLPGGSLVAQRARYQSRYRVHDHGCAQLAAAQNVIADRDLSIGQSLGHALVHALIATAN